jgi:hypothetical protein
MEEMRRHAFGCVGRAFSFTIFAIGVTMIACAFDLRLATKTGAVLFALAAAILLLKAQRTHLTPYKRTEMWHYIPNDRRPPAAHAQWAVATAMREAYERFARQAGAMAGAMTVIAFALHLLPPTVLR